MSIGANSPIWRRALFRAFDSIYFRRKIKAGNQSFKAYVSPSSSLKFLQVGGLQVDPVHERFIRDWVDADAIVWDVGANLGLFAIPAALKARKGRVYAFEPDLELAANLLRSLRLLAKQKLNVSVFGIAISNSDGAANFQISKFSRALNKLEGAGTWNDARMATQELRSVVSMRIDTLSTVLEAPTILKIDVEGAEMMVLQGGEEAIAKHRPTILLEGHKELYELMAVFFCKHDYVFLDGSADHQAPLVEPVWDTVAVPREKFARANAIANIGDFPL
jgi:FkbM family methyltransferase